MSTRCNVIIKDLQSEFIFYRHCDGYPSGVRKSLNLFLQLVENGSIRNNASQAAGWLIILGYHDSRGIASFHRNMAWKCGHYEPATKISDEIDYLYEIDLEKLTLRGWEYNKCKGEEITRVL